MSAGYHVLVEADDDRDDSKAAEVAKILCDAYPSHPWHVRIAQGVIIIKHMQMSVKMGICRKYDRVTFDARVLKRNIVMAGGEFLERARLTRGAVVDGEIIKSVEGIAPKDMVVN